MAKTKVKFRVKELEFEYEGEQASLPSATSALANQLAGMIKAPVEVQGQNNPRKHVENTLFEPASAVDEQTSKRRTKNPQSRSNGKRSKGNQAIDFSHDAQN
ncbi:MAG: hypothetical protein AAGH92_09180 [Planctomycetota bacterium]